jgi:hypothetical protein
MKLLVTVLLIAELLVSYFALAPACIYREAHVKSYKAWHEDPTPEHQQELDRQARITELHRVGLSGVAFVIMAAFTLLGARGRRPPPRTPTLRRHRDDRD